MSYYKASPVKYISGKNLTAESVLVERSHRKKVSPGAEKQFAQSTGRGIFRDVGGNSGEIMLARGQETF